jgi:4-amino-4-deoxy-L-arabinose transferase-like glycosyltransferase
MRLGAMKVTRHCHSEERSDEEPNNRSFGRSLPSSEAKGPQDDRIARGVGSKLIMVLVASFLARLALIIGLKTYMHPRLFEYERIINNILSGSGFVTEHIGGAVYKSLNNPLYSYLCAFIYAVTNHSYMAVMVAQSLVSVLLGIVIFNIGKMLFDEKVGLWSAAVVVFHPGLLYYDIYTLIPMSIDTFLIALTVLLFLRFKEAPSAISIFAVGTCVGLGMLSRSMIGAILPLAALYILIFLRGFKFGRKAMMAAVLFLGAILVIMPWTVRNYIVHKKFVFIMSTSGEALWRGNNDLATGTSLAKDGRPVLELWPEDFRKKVYSLDELGQKEFFEKEAKAFIKANPARTLKLYLKKFYYFWWFSPQSGSQYHGSQLAIYKLFYIGLLGLAATGFVSTIVCGNVRARDGAWLLFFIVLAIGLFQSVFYVEGRHRWLVEPLMAVMAVAGAFNMISFAGRKAKDA